MLVVGGWLDLGQQLKQHRSGKMPVAEDVGGGRYHCVTRGAVPQSARWLRDGEQDGTDANLSGVHGMCWVQTIPPLLSFFQHSFPGGSWSPSICLQYS